MTVVGLDFGMTSGEMQGSLGAAGKDWVLQVEAEGREDEDRAKHVGGSKTREGRHDNHTADVGRLLVVLSVLVPQLQLVWGLVTLSTLPLSLSLTLPVSRPAPVSVILAFRAALIPLQKEAHLLTFLRVLAALFLMVLQPL